jgi:lysophospholipid acyltransferase (LPLAT)-like uncharacterized protein
VVPIAYAAKPAFMLKTWDKFIIPLPFGRICMAIGEPYFPGRMDDAQMEAAQVEMEQRLLQTFQLAKAVISAPRGSPTWAAQSARRI